MLVNNLKALQNDNSEIELETIQRLQLIEKFGNDAKNGLQQARQQQLQLEDDLAQQKRRHQKVMDEQDKQKSDLQHQLEGLQDDLSTLKQNFGDSQTRHRSSMLGKQE